MYSLVFSKRIVSVLLLCLSLFTAQAQNSNDACDQSLVVVGTAQGQAEDVKKIVVSKKTFELMVIASQGDTLFRCRCGTGLNRGNKKASGDMKTPEGTFKVVSIDSSSAWYHDFKDGYGPRKGAYGPYFIRLEVPRFKGIGIHGTCFPESIGSCCSEGCIRLKNEDLMQLKPYVGKGTIVEIHPDE